MEEYEKVIVWKKTLKSDVADHGQMEKDDH